MLLQKNFIRSLSTLLEKALIVIVSIAENRILLLENLKWKSGKDLLQLYSSDSEVRWGFCKNCGTSFYYENSDEPEWIAITLASLDLSDRRLNPTCHFSFEQKAKWLNLSDTLPRYREKTNEEIK